MLSNIKISTKLLIAFLLVGLIPFLAVAIISTNNATGGLSDQVFEKLKVVQEIKKSQIEDFLNNQFIHLSVISENNAVHESMKNYNFIIADGKIDMEMFDYFGNTYSTSLVKFKEYFGYYDLILINSDGYIVYSAIKESDLGGNVINGELKDSPVARCFQSALEGPTIQDFEPYAPAGNKYISFVGSRLPVHDAVVILKMDKGQINSIIQRREGMGETGETFLVGRLNDKVALRSDFTTLGEENNDFTMGKEYSTPYVEMALNGESGQGIFNTDSGKQCISYAPIKIAGLDWAIVSKIAEAEAFASVSTLKMLNILVGVIGTVAILIVGFLFPRTIIKPIKEVVKKIKDIAEGEGDLTSRLDVRSNDEVGELATWFNTFIEKLQSIIKNIALNSSNLDTSSTDLSNISAQMSESADQMSTKANRVTGASDEMSSNMDSVAAAMEEASTNMNMVASAAEEMTSTINEIAQNSEQARTITDGAVKQAQHTSGKVGDLGKAAMEIDKVTEVITEISEQTNLLALNATIEAARAGEAGKGFAVVANEIKELARQTADATQEIKNRINGIQISTTGTVTEIEQILKTIDDVNEIVSTIASAVEEQSVTTKEIATNVAQASQGITEVNEKVAQSNKVASDINSEISEVNQSSSEMSNSSSQINLSAAELSKLAGELKEMVNRFKV